MFITKKKHKRIVREREEAIHKYQHKLVQKLTRELLYAKNPQLQILGQF